MLRLFLFFLFPFTLLPIIWTYYFQRPCSIDYYTASDYREVIVLLVCAYVVLLCSSQSSSHRSSHEFHCHLWGVHVQHQQGMLWGIYHRIQLAKLRQVLLYASNSYCLICINYGSYAFMILMTQSEQPLYQQLGVYLVISRRRLIPFQHKHINICRHTRLQLVSNHLALFL